ncbi:mucin-2-like [Pristis pectinata]|uniref:mucin-2-like n=1 Tax=Pristis pectinata TaxID=685728 RepID=UPI00223D82F3|nr:mucin-2-like [Pristis pectinata]
MQQDLDNVQAWAIKCHVTFPLQKCQAMTISNLGEFTNLPLTFKAVPITRSPTISVLGLPLTKRASLMNTKATAAAESKTGNNRRVVVDGYLRQLKAFYYGILQDPNVRALLSCLSAYEQFNIQLRRANVDGHPSITQIVMKIDGSVVEIINSVISVDDNVVTPPFTHSGIMIEKVSNYTRITAKIGLIVSWNGDDALEESVCEGILERPEFSNCYSILNVSPFIKSCMLDLCLCKDLKKSSSCLCETLSEFSRQCAHVGGKPANWRGQELCEETCHFNMTFEECGTPCADTCSNPYRSQMCDEHCIDGCFCPPNTVLDDISNSGCIQQERCPCTYNGLSYASGESYSTKCSKCVCNGGQWSCTDLPCPGVCSIEGGSHINTFDESHYTFHGRCYYVLAKDCRNTMFTVLGELQPCGITESETCLKSVALTAYGSQTIISTNPSGSVSINGVSTQLPATTANITIFKPSNFYIILHTPFGLQLQIQLVPLMQLYISLDPVFKNRMCGLCGNFNNVLNDEFKIASGLVEGTPAAFANTWKTKASCPNQKDIHENPCSLSVENAKYAKHWCGLLLADDSPFAPCHSQIEPSVYYQQCKYDSCNCEKSEDCMCAALSSYVQACAAKGIVITNWRANVCSKYTNCPKTLVYSYNMTSCHRTCQSLATPDKTCEVGFELVDGCGCAEGTYMDDTGKCVEASSCPCYYRGSVVPAGEVVHEDDAMCTCNLGKLECIGKDSTSQACVAPMIYFDCNNASTASAGTECQKSCLTLDMDCYSTDCVSGCVCPEGLVSDGIGGCIPISECPCTHNGIHYKPGEIIQVDCNSCGCNKRSWNCTNQECYGTCMIYGDGNYITFDGQRYTFNGDCEYIVAQDYCGKNPSNGTFRIITENIPCGTTGTTCSKSIKIFLGNTEIKLSDGKYEIIKLDHGIPVPYEVRHLGIYLVFEAKNGLILLWDKKTSLTIKLSHSFKGTICGLCGNYDGNVHNDFTTRSQLVVANADEFGNSWKVSPACANVKKNEDPCSINIHRDAWAQKQCSILKSEPFLACNSQVDPAPYYEACVRDACACDTGGDCECLCTAIAAYAMACRMAGECISWRTPELCPVFCSYYNPNDECEWHYAPCGIPCLKTCQNPSGSCSKIIPKLEGCYPDCPEDKPFLDEDKMECVPLTQCPCHFNGKYYKPGESVPSTQNCESCKCKNGDIHCTYDKSDCTCVYDGKTFHEGEIIYHTMDGIGGCIKATCSVNGTIIRQVYPCPPKTSTVPSTTLSFETTPTTSSGTTIKVTSEQSETTATTSTSAAATTTTTVPVTTQSTTTTTTTETSPGTQPTLTITSPAVTTTAPVTTQSTTTTTTTETTPYRIQPKSTTTSPTTVTTTTTVPVTTQSTTTTTTTETSPGTQPTLTITSPAVTTTAPVTTQSTTTTTTTETTPYRIQPKSTTTSPTTVTTSSPATTASTPPKTEPLLFTTAPVTTQSTTTTTTTETTPYRIQPKSTTTSLTTVTTTTTAPVTTQSTTTTTTTETTPGTQPISTTTSPAVTTTTAPVTTQSTTTTTTETTPGTQPKSTTTSPTVTTTTTTPVTTQSTTTTTTTETTPYRIQPKSTTTSPTTVTTSSPATTASTPPKTEPLLFTTAPVTTQSTTTTTTTETTPYRIQPKSTTTSLTTVTTTTTAPVTTQSTTTTTTTETTPGTQPISTTTSPAVTTTTAPVTTQSTTTTTTETTPGTQPKSTTTSPTVTTTTTTPVTTQSTTTTTTTETTPYRIQPKSTTISPTTVTTTTTAPVTTQSTTTTTTETTPGTQPISTTTSPTTFTTTSSPATTASTPPRTEPLLFTTAPVTTQSTTTTTTTETTPGTQPISTTTSPTTVTTTTAPVTTQSTTTTTTTETTPYRIQPTSATTSPTTVCSCTVHGRKLLPGQATVTSAGKSGLCNFTMCTDDCELVKYTGRCESTTSTPEVTTVTPTHEGTTTCTCNADGQTMVPGQATVTSAGKSGLCNFTMCTKDCELVKYTGRCESTTSTPEVSSTTVTPTHAVSTGCSCHIDGQTMAPGQATVTSAGKSGLCNFTMCTKDCELVKYTGRCESTTSTPEVSSTTVTPTHAVSTGCSCLVDGQTMAPGQATVTSAGKSGLCNFTMCTKDCELVKYTGRCESTTSTPEVSSTTVTPTHAVSTGCSCLVDGQTMAPGQATVTSAGKSGLCNFTMCTKDCELVKYTGRCESTTSTPEVSSTTVTPTHAVSTGCSCHVDGQTMAPGQATVTSAGKSGLCNFTMCTKDCELVKYTGRCESTTSTPEVSSTTVTPTHAVSTGCSCHVDGQTMAPGQATVTSAGKSGLCNFTMCTKDCELVKYTGRCESTTSTPEVSSTTVTPTHAVSTGCSCHVDGQTMAPGQAIVTSSTKSGLCNFIMCTWNCETMKYAGRCESTTSTPEVTTSTTVTPTHEGTTTCTCNADGQTMAPGQATVTSAGKSGLCNFTMCTEDCKLVKYTGRCERTTSTPGVSSTTVTPTHEGTTTCTCNADGQTMAPGFCSGWAGTYYRTFDGINYKFQGKCTYILVKQITEKIKNFKIYIDDVGAEPDMMWSKAIKIFYKSLEITLLRVAVNNTERIKALVNGQELIQPYFHDEIRISSSGITEKVEIITINSTITFDGLEFMIDLPYKIFGKNVEGQCGTCTNNKADDCTLPDGAVTSSCLKAAPHWKVTDKNKGSCETGSTTPSPLHPSTMPSAETTPSPTTTPTVPCAASDICKIIYGPIFSKCHDKVPPGPFYDTCVYDGCNAKTDTIICSSIAMYSKICKSKGDVCVNWRDHTNGTCVYHCPETWNIRHVHQRNSQPVVQGRQTKMHPVIRVLMMKAVSVQMGRSFLRHQTPVQITVVECIGPDGKPKQIGETWQSNCQDCSCNNATLSVVCKPHKCAPSPPVVCKEQGFIPVVQRNEQDLCCTETKCKPKQVCVYNDTEYKPGMTVPKDACKNCKCTDKVDPLTNHSAIECTPVNCDTHCAQGFEYKKQEGQCCGNCTQVSCIIEVPDRPPIILQPGEKTSDGKSNCTKYECKKIKGHFIPNIYSPQCPRLDHDSCEPGTIHMDSDGCCETCAPKTCSVTSTTTYINHQGCRSIQEVPMTSCGGHCMTSSVYSAEANMISHNCSCCQELTTSKKNITLLCPGGATTEFTYTYVTECGCVSTQCEGLTKQLAEPQAQDVDQRTQKKNKEQRFPE